MKRRVQNRKKSAFASTLTGYLKKVDEAAKLPGGRKWRMPKRIYKTRTSRSAAAATAGQCEAGSEAGARRVTGREMIYALLCYAEGCPAEVIAKRFKKVGIDGVSEMAVFRAKQRFERWWWGKGRTVSEIEDLVRVVEPPDPYRHSLTRNLVPALRGVAGPNSRLAEDLQWQHWTLTEIWLFVRTGRIPPRVLCKAVPGADENGDWAGLTVQFIEGRAGAERTALWGRLMKQCGVEAGEPLAPEATRESVRVAMCRGKYPHTWEKPERPQFFKTPSSGVWKPAPPEAAVKA